MIVEEELRVQGFSVRMCDIRRKKHQRPFLNPRSGCKTCQVVSTRRMVEIVLSETEEDLPYSKQMKNPRENSYEVCEGEHVVQ